MGESEVLIMKQEDLRKIGSIPFDDMSGLLKDFLGKLGGHTIWELKMFLKRMNPFPKERDITIPGGMDPDRAIEVLNAYQQGTIAEFLERERQIKKWQDFYVNFFSALLVEQLDFSSLEIPEKPEGFDRLIIVVEGLTRNGIFAHCKEKFGTWRWKDDLDKEVTSIRSTEKTYAIWVRDRVEADEENKGISLDACQKSDDVRIREGITLEERLLLELIYWDETGKHLDLANWTLCSGSRFLNGDAVLVYWHSDGRLSVYCTNSGIDNVYLRPRSVVSLKLPKAA